MTFFRCVFERSLSETQKDIIEDDRKACYKVGKATGCPKKNWAFVQFLVFRLGRGVSRGKNNSKNFGNKKKYMVV